MPEGAPVDDELSIDFTGEELFVLASALDIELPIGEPTSLRGDVAVRAALVDLARRSLIARRFLRNDGLEFAVVPAVRKMLELMAAPGMIVRLGRTTDMKQFGGAVSVDDFTDEPLVLVRSDVAIAFSGREDAGYRLTPFAPADLLDRVVRLTRLVDRPLGADVRAFDVPADALSASLRLASAGRTDAAVGALRSERAHEPSARAFVDALAGGPVAHTVLIEHRPAPTITAGGMSRWIDGGDAGLWSLPIDETVEGFAAPPGPWSAPAPLPSPVTVTPMTFGGLIDEMYEFLPA